MKEKEHSVYIKPPRRANCSNCKWKHRPGNPCGDPRGKFLKVSYNNRGKMHSYPN